MTTKRATTYGHHTQHQQRRPPDVEEALSSMLWTPYERASITDTSSDDEDELLNRHQQLRKSKSQYDYTSIPTIPPPSPTPAATPLMLPATANIVAYIPTPTHQVVTLPPGVATSTYYAATAEDICDASVTTPLVPLSSLILDAGNGHLTTMAAAADDILASSNSTVIAVAVNDAPHTPCYTPAPVPVLSTTNDSTLANDMSSSFAASLENHKNRFSFTSYGRITGLNKWWPTSHSANSNNATPTLPPPPPISSSSLCSSPLAEATVLSPSGIGSSTATTTLAVSVAPAEPKEPPSYDSLYSKAQQRQQRRLHRHAATSRQRAKHLNIFKPVLETLKANVSTITQGRFASISSSSSSSSAALLSRPDNRSRLNANNNPSNHNIRRSNMPNNSLGHGNNPCNSITGADVSPDHTTETHLVHSFTDDFLTE
ncbi:uncharacterized protein LOC133334208, partial [Musca vetustissima]|uniref:uncharacterized protein LOC133334208 n=1 Tax=Musca vetustissima TaxID=27455 RepID=UPI002AB78664